MKNKRHRKVSHVGKVYLVGAGPGDPGLLTIKGKDLLKKADVIFYDSLANKKLLSYAKRSAKKVFVGKRAEIKNVYSQKRIDLAVIAEAKKGKKVVRLKGGDPFLFGRGGEEALSLKKAQIPFEIVPGVTSAIGVPAYAGIPLTHRNFTSDVVFVSGHQSSLPWKALAEIGTIVFLMGTSNLRENIRRLILAGKSRRTPAAMISWGTYPHQKIVAGNLGDLPRLVDHEKMSPPTIVVIGKVVSLREKLEWF